MTGFRFRDAYRARVGHDTPFIFITEAERAVGLAPVAAPDRLLSRPFSATDLRTILGM